ncbi:MAG: histidine--tRNA ligase [Buchnera aphidicola (Periphyllus lyropictus)]|uniref:histidine--tRNA ligase n=1 Tax=Buchnera aphidicola TaxID=9 RepID=UPI001EC93FF9|nr:histidine--tRNA ligase [Buchnera aphidicola]NIH16606.1 histidine--tRNA ligase [Buchnera aphidicola (Periphyllus lyropictus)]USS94519.1 histidine--tRNA ligase [Buchnera aphidicola (Periphyllus lyropictus)]
MNKKIQSIRGIHDYLPEELNLWKNVENILKKIFNNYGYCEIRLPILEKTKLFKKSIGSVTDIIEKEMYNFYDRNNESLTLRPEGTASFVRAILEHNLLKKIQQRFWYFGPMFRYERPQKGRYRQFYQFGCEVYGLSDPRIDLELISLLYCFFKNLNIEKYVFLEINSIGNIQSRERYKLDLVKFLKSNIKFLDFDSKNRLYTNPLRILDSKKKSIQNLLKDAPILLNYIDLDSKNHFSNLCNSIQEYKIPFTINTRLIRGLDYYNKTVFEWKCKSENLGSQNTICAGGRYDSLIKILGGPNTPAIGFAIGMERIVAVLKSKKNFQSKNLYTDIYIISDFLNENFRFYKYIEKIRNYFNNFKIIQDFNLGSMKKKLIRAKKFKAKVIIIINNNLFKNNFIEIKFFNINKIKIISLNKIFNELKIFLNKK